MHLTARLAPAQSRLPLAALVLLLHGAALYAALSLRATPQEQPARADYVALTFVKASPASPAREARSVPRATPAPRRPAPPARPTRRFVGQQPERVSEPITAAPETVEAPRSAPRFDMESLRAAARDNESKRVATPLERANEGYAIRAADDSAMARAVKKAERADCRSAHGGGKNFNILALVPLALDTASGKGCKW
ncbi:MAG: hypothetical protein V4631_03570 [Pseudomonadota bacterium]